MLWDYTSDVINAFTKVNQYGYRFSSAGLYINNSLVNVRSVFHFWVWYFVAAAPVMLIVGMILKFAGPKGTFMNAWGTNLLKKPFFNIISLCFVTQALPILLPPMVEIQTMRNIYGSDADIEAKAF